jgi:oxygen-dependent protoporphyrinogen oxidase
VVGGGIAGLAAAWELTGGADGPTESTPRVEVIEARERLGGALATAEFAGRTIDLGADGFLARRPEAVALVRELGWADRLEPIAASGASIWLHGALRELPEGLVLGVPTDRRALRHMGGLSRRALWAAWRDEHLPTRLEVGDDVPIGAILRAKLGDELTYQLIEPMIGGIQAGRVDELSSRSVFPALLEAARRGGSLMRAMRPSGPATPGPRAPESPPPSAGGPVFYSLTSGLGSLPDELARRLGERGVVVRTDTSVTALRRTPAGGYPWEVDTYTTTTPADVVVVATAAPVAGALLGAHDPALERLRDVASAGAAMVTFALPRDEVTLTPSGTGVLVPLGTPWREGGSMMVTAITFLDRKWPRLQRETDVVLRAHVGRSDDPRWVEMDDESLTRRVEEELAVLLPRFGSPSASRVQRWPGGLPQYLVGHEDLVSAARAACARLRVALAGSAYDGVGVPASVGSGRRAAREALAVTGAGGDAGRAAP